MCVSESSAECSKIKKCPELALKPQTLIGVCVYGCRSLSEVGRSASKTVMGQEDSNLKMVNWIPIMESDALAYPRETAEPLSAVAPK